MYPSMLFRISPIMVLYTRQQQHKSISNVYINTSSWYVFLLTFSELYISGFGIFLLQAMYLVKGRKPHCLWYNKKKNLGKLMHLYDLARAYIQWCSQVMGIGQAPTVH